ncbi:MAG TPA: oxidoreductase, partial [Roseiflexaceae bacterium]
RGAGLRGVDSVLCPPARRRAAWQRLARDLPAETLARMTTVAPLRDVPALSDEITRGQVRGRVVVDVSQA